MKKPLVWVVLFAILFGVANIASAQQIEVGANNDSIQHKIVDSVQMSCTAVIDDNFEPDEVLIVMKNQYSIINKDWLPSDFYPVEVSDVVDLQLVPQDRVSEFQALGCFRSILKLTLAHPGKQNVLDAIKILQERDDVYAAEPNYTCLIYDSTTPDDPFYSVQTALKATQVDKAWDFTTGSSSITVGVFDSWVYNHPDLEDNLISGYNFTGSNPNQSDSHGTNVAGVIAAKGNNGLYSAGIAWKVKIQPYIVDTVASFVQSFQQAKLNNIPIINISNGFDGINSTSINNLKAAIENYGGSVICSAGNNNKDIGASGHYPAALDCSNIITVGACYESGGKYTTSNYGDSEVDLFAPWQAVTVGLSDSTNQYSLFQQTSAAAPQVTGVAALLKSYKPSLTTAQLKAAILDGAASKSALNGLCVTGGMLDAYGALLEVTGNLKNYDVEIGVNATDKITTMFVNLNFNSSVFFPTAYGHGSAANTYDAVGDSVAGRLTYYYSNSSKPSPGGVLGWAKLSAPQSLSPARNGLTISKVTSSPSTANAYLVSRLIGDVNNDDNINSTDVLYINQYLSGTRTLSSDQIKRGDVNFDGKVDVTDMLLLNQYNVELVRTFW